MKKRKRPIGEFSEKLNNNSCKLYLGKRVVR